MKKAYYFLVIIILFSSCNNIPSKVVKEKVDSISSTNTISLKDLRGELFYLGDTTSLKLDSNIIYNVTRLFNEDIHNEGLFDEITATSIMFAKNNLLKINYTKTQERSVSLTGTYGSSYHQSIGNVTESFSGVLKYSIKGDTLLLPATTVSIYNKIPPSKYKIKLQGDSLVHLQLILSNKELALRRDNIRRTLNIYYDYFPKEYPFERILDAVTNFRCKHTFLILKYD